jgi:hypothetical protein
VQPGLAGSVFGQSAFNDFVIVEATKDGLNWIPLANGYNSSSNASWLSAYNSSSTGSTLLNTSESFDFKNKFTANDTLLLRFRLHSNSDAITGWGWSIDNLYVQQQPTAVEPIIDFEITLYPNPTTGIFKMKYTLENDSDVGFDIWDMTGRVIEQRQIKSQSPGSHEEEFNLRNMPDGVYIVKVSTYLSSKTIKFVIRR